MKATNVLSETNKKPAGRGPGGPRAGASCRGSGWPGAGGLPRREPDRGALVFAFPKGKERPKGTPHDSNGHFSATPTEAWVPGPQVRVGPGTVIPFHSPAAPCKGCGGPAGAPRAPRPRPGPKAFSSPARLTSCPWRRRGGTRRLGPRRTASCRPVPAHGRQRRGRRRAQSLSPSRQQRDLNAPPAGPPRPQGPGLSPRPLHLTTPGSDPDQTDGPSSHESAGTWFSPAWTRPGDPQCTKLLGPLLLPCAPHSLPAGNRKPDPTLRSSTGRSSVAAVHAMPSCPQK